MQLSTKYLGDASKNCIAWVRGQVNPSDEGGFTQFLDLEDISADAQQHRPSTLQFGSALWTLQEKLGLRIWMSRENKVENLLLLMESRNSLRLDRALQLDDWAGKLYLEPFNVNEPKWFWFQLDFDKGFKRK